MREWDHPKEIARAISRVNIFIRQNYDNLQLLVKKNKQIFLITCVSALHLQTDGYRMHSSKLWFSGQHNRTS